MDGVREKNDGDSVYSAGKKNKKRKNRESCDLSGHELGDEVARKKMKTKISGGVSDEVVGEGTDKSSRKKKKKDKSQIDVNAQEVDNKGEGEIEKYESKHKGEMKKKKKKKSEKVKDAEFAGVGDADANQSDRGITDVERVEGQKRKKDKSRIDVNAREDDNKREEKIEKDKSKHKGEMKKNKKKKSENVKDAEFAGADDTVGDADANQSDCGITNVECVEGQKRKKKKHRKVLDMKGDVDAGVSEIKKVNGSISQGSQMNNEGTENVQPVKEKKREKKKDNQGVDSLNKEPKKKRKGISVACDIDRDMTGILKDSGKNETAESSLPNKKSKKVKFADNVEVIPHPDISRKKKKATKDGGEEKKTVKDGGKQKKKVDDGLIRGKRFSKEEDEIIQNAVYKYIKDHNLGEEGLTKVLNCKSHPEVKNCWREIGEALPQRPYLAVYTRAHILFERSDARTWTPEEIEFVKTFVEKHGPDWKTLSIELGKHRFHIKDAWRRHKLPNLKRGSWSAEEYAKLFDLINRDLRMKAFTEKKTKHGMLRDNISWEAISDELSTRSNPLCCMKWYNQLTSPMVAEGNWANVDDYRLLIALNELDAPCEEDVDWDNLLEHRSGDLCRKRWHEMVRHIGENGSKLFSEQVEILSGRYCPDLLEEREAFDNRPFDD